MTALVELDRVSVHFDQRRGLLGRRSVLHAVEQVSLTIAEGETVGLVGESGSGKSTLGHVIAGLRKPTQGEMRFRGHSLDRASIASGRRRNAGSAPRRWYTTWACRRTR